MNILASSSVGVFIACIAYDEIPKQENQFMIIKITLLFFHFFLLMSLITIINARYCGSGDPTKRGGLI
jgi:hypothetical protein